VVAVPVSQPDFFSVFGVKRRFGLDKAELETRFYKLSRELHPDRFATGSATERMQALEKMSLVNEAYRTLKDSELLRDYFLKLAGIGGDAKAQIPIELAESWFELQEALMEDPIEGHQKVEAFGQELLALQEKKRQDIQALERQIDSAFDSAGGADELPLSGSVLQQFEKLAAMVRDLNYLESMERDVERIRGKRNVG
jgi:molecular chaperone HscB